jgi:hypothetical protein
MYIYIREEAKRVHTTNWNNYCVDVRDLLQKFKGHCTLTTEKYHISWDIQEEMKLVTCAVLCT